MKAFPNATAFGIIDGQFFQSFSVSSKEILTWMDRGKRFWGSSSMGALRATELELYGMIGVGQMYRMFSCGEIDADDEVAMTYDPVTFKANSEPLVNMRISLNRSSEGGYLSRAVMETAIGITKKLYYPDRSYRSMLLLARASLSKEDFMQLNHACRSASNAKGEDASVLLAAMGLLPSGECGSEVGRPLA